MKTWVYVLMFLVVFTSVYTFIIVKSDYGVMDLDEYQEGECEPERLEDGYTRLENCAEYKLKENPKSLNIKLFGVEG